MLHVGGACTGCPLHVTLGKKPQVFATTRLSQALSSSTPEMVPHWFDALQVAFERVPWQVAAVLHTGAVL